ncbi:MAG TPA: hypothetical protein VMU38_07865 [Candidatus Binatia bacterium]|nr:hypothetical protein [Candidatus Binatia bacterium]
MWHRLGLVLIGLLSLALSCILGAGARSQSAPADEYFGRAQMSPLEITNRIGDAERRGASYNRLMTTQAAIEDWVRKYPADPWIPQREYRMSHLFARLHSRSGDAEAARCRTLLRADFPGNHYTVVAQREERLAVSQKATRKRHHFLGITF